MKRYLALWAELFRLSWRKEPRLVGGLLAARTASVAAVAASALSLREAVDAALAHHAGPAVAAALGAALTYGVTSLLRGATGGLRILLVEKVGLTDLLQQIHRDIATVEGLDHLERTDFLDRVTVVRNSAWGIADSLWASVDAVFNVVEVIVALVLLGTMNPWLLFLLAFAAVPLWFDQRGLRAVKEAETATAEAFRLQRHLFELATSPSAGKELRVAGSGPQLARLQQEAWDEAMRGRARARISAAVWKMSGWGLFTAGFVAGLALVAHRVAHGHGTVGDIMLTVAVANNLRESVHFAVVRATDTASASRLIEPYLWLRDWVTADRARVRGGEKAPEVLRAGIAFENVSYAYPGTDRPALDGVDVTLPAGSVVAIVGEYGSGKTTLVKLLAKFYRPDSGRITVDGRDLAELDTEDWRSRSSAAFQDFGRLHTSFAEAVGLGDLAHVEDRERIAEAVRAADAESLVARLPDGLDSQLGREFDGVDLSEGQWQKTALARASMRPDPLLFVLDEPTASLDAPSEDAIFARYMQRARDLATRTGAVTVIVSHRFSTVTGADLILVLDHGRLTEAGTHEELVLLGGRYADLYSIQANAYASTG
ncbi:ABC transporter ATP-binding protein [Streptomyces sp. NPDC003758]|uniref:ABC transporter ATP-binding protein/permease n=1 Tax=Streptomyces cynarae TaxID=2981134 RepID=A0ABY6E8K6_9ACTN|nr:ABC transporter ATP-binding protein [Streptomyces cynarae]UXY22238.1 ABC transporter ATP-binding protein/permease [Streptomyces cynarae]